MRVHVLYIATIAFAVGVAVGSINPLGFPFIGLLAVVTCGLAAVAMRGNKPQVVLACVACGCIALGALRMEWAWSQVGVSPLMPVVGQAVSLQGTVAHEPAVRERSLHVLVTVGEDTLLLIVDRYAEVRYGDVLQISGVLEKPESFTTDLGRTFNYPGYLLARGVEFQMFYPELVVMRRAEGNPLLASLYRLKQTFLSALGRYLPEPQFGLAAGILLGVKQALGDELENVFRTAGLAHIVVLSGFNVMLVVTFVTWLLSFLFPSRLQFVLALVAIVGFALMVGLSATVVRASIMAAFALAARSFGRGYIVLRGLLLAGAIMLVINPFLLLYDIGFQLSFMATVGLILLSPRLESYVPEGWRGVRVHEFLLATLATQVAVLPLLLYHIGEVSLVAVVVNVLVLPMVPVAMFLVFVTGVAAHMVPAIAAVLAYPTYASLSYIIAVAEWWAKVPYAAVVVPAFSPLLLMLAYGVLSMLTYWWLRKLAVEEVGGVDVSGWTIEEESLVVETQKGAPRSGAPSEALPVFFRK